MRPAPLLVAIALVPALVGRAAAYVRTTTSTGTPVEWRGRCAELTLGAEQHPDFRHDRLRPLLERAIGNWSQPTDACTALSLTLVAGERARLRPMRDHLNTISWRLPGHCDDPAHHEDEVCEAPQAAAVTTVFYIDKPGDPNDGELLEVDVVINAAHNQFTDGDGGPDGALDLESVVTHELGHVLGLTHTCYTSSGRPAPQDELAARIPNCFPSISLPSAVTEATMYNFISPGETFSRDPLENEVEGICAIYADHPGTCRGEPAGCGCRSGRFGAGLVLPLLLASLLLVLRRKPCKRPS